MTIHRPAFAIRNHFKRTLKPIKPKAPIEAGPQSRLTTPMTDNWRTRMQLKDMTTMKEWNRILNLSLTGKLVRRFERLVVDVALDYRFAGVTKGYAWVLDAPELGTFDTERPGHHVFSADLVHAFLDAFREIGDLRGFLTAALSVQKIPHSNDGDGYPYFELDRMTFGRRKLTTEQWEYANRIHDALVIGLGYQQFHDRDNESWSEPGLAKFAARVARQYTPRPTKKAR